MNRNIKRLSALLACLLLCISLLALPVGAATTGYFNSYSNIAAINDRSKCTRMQGMAVGSTYLYTVKINGNDDKAFLAKTNKNTGETVILVDSATGSKYLNYLGHANDMEVASVNGKSNLYVVTMLSGSNSFVRLKVSGSTVKKMGSFTLKLNGEEVSASGVALMSKTDTTLTFLFKRGTTFYTGTIARTAKSGTIELTKVFTIDIANVVINGKSKDLTSYIHQGFEYHKGKIYVPLTGPDGAKQISIIAVYNVKNATGKVTSDPSLSFRITSKSYADLFEIESCGISSDGKLYFNTNRRKAKDDGNHDGIHVFKNYTFS